MSDLEAVLSRIDTDFDAALARYRSKRLQEQADRWRAAHG